MTKAVAGFFSSFAKRYYSASAGGDELGVCMSDVAADLHRFYKILDSQPLFVSPDATMQLGVVCARFGSNYERCRSLCERRGILAFQITPKLHKMQHVPDQSRIFNPVRTSNYSYESFIGSTTQCWKRSLSGRYKRSSQRVVLIKRLVSVLLRMT